MDYDSEEYEIMEECDQAIHKYKQKVRNELNRFMLGKVSRDEFINDLDFYKNLIDMERKTYRKAAAGAHEQN